MSTSRIFLRVLLVLMIIGLLVLGVFIWRRGTPDYYWSRAQKAIEAKQYEGARIELSNLVRRHPTHADGWELLARTVLLESESKGRPATYPANPRAAEFLAKAAELKPGDAALQRRVLRAWLSLRQFGKAADVAEEVYKVDPMNGDAHFALMWRAVEKKDAAEVAKLTAAFENPQFASSHVFQNYALMAKHHWEADDKTQSDVILAEAASIAGTLKPEQIQMLERRDREAMLALLLGYQDRAEKPEEALRRSRQVLDACRKLDGAQLIDKRTLANAAAQSVALFNMKYPPISLEKGLMAVHTELAKEAEQLGSAALADKEGGPAPMLVYWNTARSHMSNGDFDKAMAVLNDGFKAAKQLGDAIGEQDLDLHLLAARILIMQRDFAAANDHLDKLIGNKRFEGWGHLLKGSVALHEGRLQPAETHFAAARKALGDTVLVKMSMAHTAMALEQWDKAVPMLEELLESEPTLSEEQKAWFVQLLGSGTRVHFDLLRAKLAQKRWADAQKHLQALKGSEFEPGAWALAVAYKWDEEKDEAYARKLLDLSRQKFPDDLNLVMLDARLLSDKGQNAEATRALENYAKAKPDDERRQLALARWLIRNREPNKAIDILEALESQPNLTDKGRSTLAVYRVQALIGSRQIELAKTEADALTKNEDTKTAGYLMKAALAFRDKDEKAGIALLEEAQKTNPRNAPLAMMVSKIRGAQGDFEGVLDAGVDVMDVNRFSVEARATVGNALQKLAEEQGPEKALAKVDEFLKARPNEFSLRVLKVDFLVRLKEFEKAMRELDLAQLQSPDDPNIPRLKAQVLVANARADEALVEAKRAVELDPKNTDVMLLASQVAIAAKQYKEAAKFADTARRAAPSNAQAYILLADALRQDGQVDAAVAVLKNYAQRNPKDPGIRLTIIELLRTTPGHEADAIAEVRQARRAQPEDFRLPLMEIDMLIAMERPEEAQAVARDVLGSSATVAQMLSVGQVFANVGEVVSAEHWGKEATKIAKANERPEVDLFLGRLYLREGRADEELGRAVDVAMLDKARTHFTAVLDVEPRHLVAGNNLAWLLAQHFDRAEEAVRIVEQIRAGTEVGKMPAAFIDTMALCYIKAGQPDKAKQLLRAGLTSYPKDPQLLYRLGMQVVAAQPTQAKEMLQRAVEIGGLEKTDEALARAQLERL